MDELLATLNSGRGATILVEGVPGIGKTALLRYARAHAAGANVRVLAASGSEMDRHLAFSGLRQLFFDVLRSGAELTGPAAAAAPALGLRELAEPPDAAAVAHALRWVLTGLAAVAPVLLVVDDLQWLDPGSRQVLAHLSSRTRDCPIGFLLATRPDDVAVDFEQMLRDSDSRELHPAPLSARAVATLVADCLAGVVHEDFVTACVEVTGGLPFLVTELLRDVRGRGLAADADSAAVVRNLAPRAIQRHVLARLELVSDTARRFARSAAILPPGADALLAAEVAGIPECDCASALGQLVEVYVLRDRPLDFVHPVMRAAVVESLAGVEISETHRRAAAALRDRNARPADIALHLLHAEPRGCAADAEMLVTAGLEAAAAGAPETAIEYLRRALAEPPPPDAHAATLAALGRALAATGDATSVPVLQSAYDAAVDTDTRTHTALHLAEALVGDENRPRDAVRILQHAIQGLGEDDDRRLAVLARLAVFATRAGLTDVLTWCLSEIPPALTGETSAQRACMVVLAHCPTPAEPRPLLLTVASNPDFVTSELPGSIIVGWAITALRAIGELSLALHVAERAAEHAQGCGRPAAIARRLAQVAMMQWRLGRVPDALATVQSALMFSDARTATGDWAWVETVRVRVTLAAGLVDAADDAARLLPDGPVAPEFVRLARAEIAAARGDLARAVELYPYRHPDVSVLDAVEVDPAHRAAMWLAALGRLDEARHLLHRLDNHLARFGSPAVRARMLTATGIIERDDDKARRGVEMLADTEFRYAHAEALIDLGMFLRRTGALKEARTALRTGVDQARAMGAGMLANTATAELAIAGGRRVARASWGTAALTKSELRVARRAAEGATNAQIADALFINVKTVEMHLANSYRKLGIAGRTHLPEVLGAPGANEVDEEPMSAHPHCEPAS